MTLDLILTILILICGGGGFYAIYRLGKRSGHRDTLENDLEATGKAKEVENEVIGLDDASMRKRLRKWTR